MGAVGSLVCVQGSVAIHLLDGGGMGGWGRGRVRVAV